MPPEVPPARGGPGPQPRLLNTVPTELPRLLRSRGRVPRGACGMLAIGFTRLCPRARRAGATRRGSARGPEPRAGSPLRRESARPPCFGTCRPPRREPDRPGGGCRVRDGARIRRPACAVRAHARASRALPSPQRDALSTAFGLSARAAPGSLPRQAGAERSIGVASGAPRGVSAHAAPAVPRVRRARANESHESRSRRARDGCSGT